MIKIQCVGRRRLEITKIENGNFEIKIILTGPEKLVATLIVSSSEVNKLRELWENA